MGDLWACYIKPWKTHEIAMGDPREVHEQALQTHGSPTGVSWETRQEHCKPMGGPWWSPGRSMSDPRTRASLGS